MIILSWTGLTLAAIGVLVFVECEDPDTCKRAIATFGLGITCLLFAGARNVC